MIKDKKEIVRKSERKKERKGYVKRKNVSLEIKK